MRVQQVVQGFYIVACLYRYHQRLFIEQIKPFLAIPVIHDEVLPHKSIPAITLEQVQTLIKTRQALCIRRQVFPEILFDTLFIFFIPRMAVPDIPGVQLQRQVRQLCNHHPFLIHLIGLYNQFLGFSTMLRVMYSVSIFFSREITCIKKLSWL